MFTLTFVTPEKQILKNAAISEVIVPAYRGELNILPGHADLLTTLDIGVVRYKLEGEIEYHSVAVSWGYCLASQTAVKILADYAELPKEINIESVRQAKQQVEKAMATAQTAEDFKRLNSELKKTQVLEDLTHQH